MRSKKPESVSSMVYGYDPAGRLNHVAHSGVLPQTIGYVLDAVGNRTQMQVDSGAPTAYQYDPLYRLTSVTYPEGDSTAYTYDPVGNRLSMQQSGSGTTSYIYDDADQLTQVAGMAYTYDENGNLRTRGEETYDYDHENRMTRIAFDSFDPPPPDADPPIDPGEWGGPDFNGDGVLSVTGDVSLYRGRIGSADPLLDINNDGVLTVTGDVYWFVGKIGQTCPRKFSYNGDGLRVAGELGRFWTDYTWDVGAGLPVVLQETYREKTKMPQETRYVKTYVYGLDLISVYTDDLEHGTTAQDYYFSDGLGSTVTLARDSVTNETSAYTYDAFGEVRTESGTLLTDFLFTGEQRDSESDLYYLRARYYDAGAGRFLTRDPFPGLVVNPQTQNPYPYVVNNPANFADPAGFQAQEAVGTGVVICGAGGAESGGAACAVAVVAAAGVYVCVAGACEVLGEAGGTVIEGLGDLAGDALGGLRSLFPHGGGAPQADRNPPDFNPWYPGPNGWWRPGFDFGNLPPWMRNALRITAAGTIVGIVLKEVGDIFAPLLPGEKPPVRPVHLYYSP